MVDKQKAKNLEEMVSKPLDLADLAIQVAASEHSKPQYKGDQSHPEYVKAALDLYEKSCTQFEKEKFSGPLAALNIAQKRAMFAYESTGEYTLNEELSAHFNAMKKGYYSTLEKSNLDDLNNALAKYGFKEKLTGENKPIKEIIEKGKSKDATDIDKAMAHKINYATMMLIELAKTKLSYESMSNIVKELNKQSEQPKEEAPQN